MTSAAPGKESAGVAEFIRIGPTKTGPLLSNSRAVASCVTRCSRSWLASPRREYTNLHGALTYEDGRCAGWGRFTARPEAPAATSTSTAASAEGRVSHALP